MRIIFSKFKAQKQKSMKQKVIRTFVLVLFLASLVASLAGQEQLPEFKVGASLGHTIDNENQFTDWDFNLVTNYNRLIVTLGVLTDQRVNGWGRRVGLGAKVTDQISFLGTVSDVDRGLIVSHISYGVDIGYKVWDGVHFTLGVETKRGIRVGIKYLKW